jgi:hypothetical protein
LGSFCQFVHNQVDLKIFDFFWFSGRYVTKGRVAKNEKKSFTTGAYEKDNDHLLGFIVE